MKKPGRNDPCPCGSGKKYKQCCLQSEEALAANKHLEAASIPGVIQVALEHHQAGRLPQAEALYQQILQAAPNHPDALHLLGLIASQAGRAETAVELIGKAIHANPSNPMYFNNLGIALQTQCKLDAAVESYLKALLLKPDYANAYYNLGNALKDQGKLDTAVESYRKALAFKPDYAEALNNMGLALQAQGKLDEAIKHYHHALSVKPDYAETYNNLGTALKDQGKPDEAVKQLHKALALKPGFTEAYSNLGNALLAQGKLDEAAKSYREALSINPDYAEAHYNIGNLLKEQGKLDAAIESYRKTLSIKPGHVEALNNQGLALQAQDKLDDAIRCYHHALAIRPDYAEAHNNLGAAFKDQGKLEEAVGQLHKALALKPGFPEAHSNLGSALLAQGKPDEAAKCYREALSINPGYAEAHYNMGNLFKDQGELDEAIKSYREALSINPDYAEAINNLGLAFQAQDNIDAAVENYRKVLSIKPDYVEAINNLGLALQAQGNLDAAVESYRKALAFKPDYAKTHNNLGNTFKDQGKLDEAVESYQKALSIKPDFAEAYNNLLFLHAYHALLGPQEYLAVACGWEQACLTAQDRQEANGRIFQRKPLAGRRLKVGYVSGDYRGHAVSCFVEHLFAHHDRSRIELFAYPTHGKRDAVTEQLQASAEHWVSLAGMADVAARERIEADGIDVLVDLSGHTAHNRLGILARRAAPVQVHYLGYFASTGLTEMDYWIGDGIMTPPEMDSHFSEQVWRLPRVWVSYEGKAEAPLPDWHPAGDGSVWVGSFNNLGKLTPATLALWAQVLHALPEAKLLLKTRELADDGNRRRILDGMAEHGIAPDRVELRDSGITPGWPAHMAYYDRLDIALDPVGGVGGGTTTCDALWMGAPVITLMGDRMASRMTASMLDAIGQPEWVARSEAEYVGKVVALARDVEQRKALRYSQRGRMARSPLCDARGLAACLENAYVEMFERWVEKQNERPSV